jgi:hypothetical protein
MYRHVAVSLNRMTATATEHEDIHTFLLLKVTGEFPVINRCHILAKTPCYSACTLSNFLKFAIFLIQTHFTYHVINEVVNNFEAQREP